MRVTIREVAVKAGVSVTTVSRVFNDSAVVSAATRQRVFDAATALRYSPNLAARSLITRQTHTIGLLLPDLYGEFFSEIMRGIDQVATQHGYHLLVSNSHNDQQAVAIATRHMRGRVDGLILMAPDIDGEFLATVVPDHLPVVLLNSWLDLPERDALHVDSYRGARDVVEHLIQHGHRRVAMLKGSDSNIDARERLRGYRDALIAAGCALDEPLEVSGNFTESSGYAGALQLLALAERPTAIFAANDSMAIGALSALRARGLAVPEDMAVAGFDDIPIAAYLTPALTSVRVHISELGVRACQRLIDAMHSENGHAPHNEVIQTEVIPRQSCGCTGSLFEPTRSGETTHE
jgi:LacI family transcriptional regulator